MSDSKEKIIKILSKNPNIASSFLVKKTGLSRQTIAKHLKDLREDGLVAKKGGTKSATYSLAKDNTKKIGNNELKLIKTLEGLEEHLVYKELDLRLGLSNKLNKNAQSIAFYAFTEMLNNAIDHSQSKKVHIKVGIHRSSFEFEIVDQGIGVFYNIQKYYKLDNEFDAINWLLAGKKTTMPSRHSGEGLFFTSKIADKFSIGSHDFELKVSNLEKDISVKDIKKLKGTEVKFSIKANTKKKLSGVFEKYTNEDFEFIKSKSVVKISSGKAAVSRSQARKLLASFEKFEHVILDLQGVTEIGQAFCDEIFRVYKERNPKKLISWINAGPAVEFMIQRSLKLK